jgi:hypothetical protein
VIDFAVGYLGFLESIMSWEVSSDPSLSNHRYILFTLRGYVSTHLIRTGSAAQTEKRYVRLPTRLGGPSVAPLMTYQGQLGYIGLFLGTLRSGLDPWWLLLEGVRNPKEKLWISNSIRTSPTRKLLRGEWHLQLTAVLND